MSKPRTSTAARIASAVLAFLVIVVGIPLIGWAAVSFYDLVGSVNARLGLDDNVPTMLWVCLLVLGLLVAVGIMNADDGAPDIDGCDDTDRRAERHP